MLKRSFSCLVTVVALAALSPFAQAQTADEEEDRSLMDFINAMEASGPEAAKATEKGPLTDLVQMRQLEFGTNEHRLTPVHKEYLDSIAGHLLRAPGLNVYVQGHTDNVGNSITNQKLSQLRAASVKEYLVLKGFPAENIESEGFGETRPLPSALENATEEQRKLNRRVELLVLQDMVISRKKSGDVKKADERGEFEIRTKDGQTIRSKDVVISEDGQDVSYYDPNDKVMKRLRAVDLDRVITPEGEAVRLAEVATEINKENTKRVAEEEVLQQKYDAAIKAADAAFTAGNYDEAERLYREARSYRPRDPYAKERLVLITKERNAPSPPGPPPPPSEPKTFWGKMKGRFEESFVFLGFGLQPLREGAGFEVRDDSGIERIDHDRGDGIIPVAPSALIGYEWENNKRQRSFYFRTMYEFMIMKQQVHKASFGAGYAFHDRFRAGVDVFMAWGSRKIDPRIIPSYQTWQFNGVEFGPGEIDVKYRQFFMGFAPNASMGFFVSPRIFGRVSAGVNLHLGRSTSYSVKLEGTDPQGNEVSTRLYSSDGGQYYSYYYTYPQLYPRTGNLIYVLGPFINFQFVFQ